MCEARESKANSSIDDLNLKRGTEPIFSQVNKSWQPHHLIVLQLQCNMHHSLYTMAYSADIKIQN